MKKIVVMSGAGISAESGIKTFRDADGLWEGYNVLEVATPEGWNQNPQLVLEFYNQRRRQLLQCKPNVAHYILAELESSFDVQIITQNVDDLHERAGSSKVLHLHGELLKARSTSHSYLIYECVEDISLGTTCELGSQLRPHIVWFGEAVPELERAIEFTGVADIIIVIGTSLQVYPAAGLVSYAPNHCKVYYIDPKPSLNSEMLRLTNLLVIPKIASEGMKEVLEILNN